MAIGVRSLAKKVAKTVVKVTKEPDNYCCGLSEIGGFYGPVTIDDIKKARQSSTGQLVIATTIKEQKMDTKMKEAGFKELQKFKGNYGNEITLWSGAVHD